MDTLFRLVNLHSSDQQQPQPQQPPPQPQQQQSSYNSSRTNSSSSRSTTEHQPHYYNQYNYYNNNNNSPYPSPNSSYYHYPHQPYQDHSHFQEECGTNNHLYMDEDFSSSSSSKHFQHQHAGRGTARGASSSHHHNPRPSPPTPTATPLFDQLPPSSNFSPFPQDLNLDFSSPSSSSATTSGGVGGGRWASQLLLECARAIAARDSQRTQQLMWMLNELSSAYGDTDQKIAAYFLQGLFARMTASGTRTLQTLSDASDRNCSFESTRETALRFQELSPWSSFGHVAANGAILESFLESSSSSTSSQQSLHILDFSNTFCTQWPTLLEALATRSSDDTPHLAITTVVSSTSPSSSVQKVMKEIGQRMEKFARLMGVPFKFNIVHHTGDLSNLDLDSLDLGGSGTALAINCINSLRSVAHVGNHRQSFINSLHRLNPRIVTVVEEDADLEAGDGTMDEDGDAFLKRFKESLRFFSAYMESLEESFPRTSNERLVLERSAGRAIVDLIACPSSESVERRDTSSGWSRRMRDAGFSVASFSEDVSDDVRALLRRYRDGWSMQTEDSDDSGGVFLAWKGMPMVWASAWRP